ncbi:MAG: HD domain-containing protein [Eubacterium sp.]|nr:HD domain-containing protein [Eubacterium sp.]
MKYIQELAEGNKMSGIYFVKSRIEATTKTGRTYLNCVLQDKTGLIDAKVWDVDSPAIADFAVYDYVDIVGDVSLFAGSLQVAVRRLRVAQPGEYNTADYMPCSRYSPADMYKQLMSNAEKVQNPYLKALISRFFVEDEEFIKEFKACSAAKTIHHSFISGLLEHTMNVVRMCVIYSKLYPMLNYDLLITAAMFHDVGKLKELSRFPANDYTDEGQLLGHILIGAEMIHDAAKEIPGFPETLEDELKHCILSHHGELEYGSPKKPALAEAVALSLADLTDARLETMRELLESTVHKEDWLGFNRIFESNIRKTTDV